MNAGARIATGLLCVLAAGRLHAADVSLSWRDGLDVDMTDQLEFSLGVRLQGDVASFDDDETALEDDNDFRRARVVSQLDWSAWRLRADYDFGISEGWKNLFVQYRGFRRQRITLGNHVAPFSMEDSTGSQHLPLLERSIAGALNPGILFGLSYRRWGDRWSTTAGLFGNEFSDLDRRRLPGNSLNGRVTFAPLRGSTAAIHLGAAGEFRRIRKDESVRFRVRPGTRLTDRRLINTRRIEGVERSHTLGVEFAAFYENLRFQSEATHVALRGTQNRVAFNSHYVMASMLLGGGAYRYSHSRGTFRSIRPEHRWGALELAVRRAYLDLTDGPVTGGQQTEMTYGISWIVNRQFRVMVNYSDINASPNRNGIDEQASLWSMRLQFGM